MGDKTIIHFEGKDMPVNEWLDLVMERQRRQKPNGEATPGDGSGLNPATYTRNNYDDE